jgi:GxxExxY protein
MSQALDALTERIIGAAIEVHQTLGPGMLESAYESCLVVALAECGLTVERQKLMPLQFKGASVNLGYRLDLLVEDLVVVEIKAIQHLERVHMAQLLSYLRLSGCEIGLLFNFNVTCLTRGGLKRVVNGYSA